MRAVRPLRCTYASLDSGTSVWTTTSTSVVSRPLAPMSVTTRMSLFPPPTTGDSSSSCSSPSSSASLLPAAAADVAAAISAMPPPPMRRTAFARASLCSLPVSTSTPIPRRDRSASATLLASPVARTNARKGRLTLPSKAWKSFRSISAFPRARSVGGARTNTCLMVGGSIVLCSVVVVKTGGGSPSSSTSISSRGATTPPCTS
mmetsp:Transcript_5408/g.13640  ORF Transcript_5408/g.13640 Transcript_5408/m.13640 type:complete len:204 (+) Transcript_5408:1240-1851(+)